jgi:hypothetical protein
LQALLTSPMCTTCLHLSSYCTYGTPEDGPKRVETCSVVFNVYKVLRGRKSLIVLSNIRNRMHKTTINAPMVL